MSAGQDSGSVLVVEDDLQIAAVLNDLPESEGYRVSTSVNRAALGQAQAAPPDPVLLDAMMPGLARTEVCRHLNADPRTRDVPVVFLTAMPPDVLAPRLAGCVYRTVIRKPFSLTEVLDTVERYLQQ